MKHLLQDYLDRPINCPATKKRRSYENVGRPTKEFEDKSEEGKRLEVRKSLETLEEAGTDSALAIYKMAKVKADDEGQRDASFILSKIYEDPIQNGANIRAALTASENEGILLQKKLRVVFLSQHLHF